MTDHSNNPPALPQAKIDWYSFTIPLTGALASAGADALEFIDNVISKLPLSGIDPVTLDGTWRLASASGFYSYRATHLTSGLSVSWGTTNAHLFVELPGQACQFFRTTGSFNQLVQATHERATRVDAAVDLVTDISPATFVASGHAIRFADSVGNIKSPTGQTCYVGSRKSDRCARIYRYAAPHPRCNLLRVECEYKGTSARTLAKCIAVEGELAAIRAAHAPFAWKSEVLVMDFLQCRPYLQEPAISPDMVNIAGSCKPYFLPYDATTKEEFLTLPRGLRIRYYQRWRRRNH